MIHCLRYSMGKSFCHIWEKRVVIHALLPAMKQSCVCVRGVEVNRTTVKHPCQVKVGFGRFQTSRTQKQTWQSVNHSLEQCLFHTADMDDSLLYKLLGKSWYNDFQRAVLSFLIMTWSLCGFLDAIKHTYLFGHVSEYLCKTVWGKSTPNIALRTVGLVSLAVGRRKLELYM